jgi:acetyltransferase-like isoleucine patch superfamily enzyme
MDLFSKLRTHFVYWKARTYRKSLDRVAVIGEGLCRTAVESESYILNFRLRNLTGIRERVRIGRFCNLGMRILCDGKGSVTIGDYVYFNSGGVIRSAHAVNIGSHCLFGPGVAIWDTDNHPLSRAQRHKHAETIPFGRTDPYEAGGGPITIGNDVWVCMDALILGGVTIGDGSIVAARSVVTHDVAPMTMVAGCPARVIGQVPP